MKDAYKEWFDFFKKNPAFLVVLSVCLIVLLIVAPFQPEICSQDDQNGSEYCIRHNVCVWLFAFVDRYSGAISAIAAIVIAGFTYTLRKASIDQGRLTKESITLSRNDFEAEHRPWVSVVVKSGWVRWHPDRVTFSFWFELHNSGRTPAMNVVLDCDLALSGDGFAEQANLAAEARERTFNIGTTIFPGLSFHSESVRAIREDRMEEVWQTWKRNFGDDSMFPGFFPVLVGCITYNSVFDSTRKQTGFIKTVRRRGEQPGLQRALLRTEGDLNENQIILMASLRDGHTN